jgi:aminoglycoside phosphotransferase (APT) family kinase protein
VRAPLARERLDRVAAQGVWQPDPAVHTLLAEAAHLGPPDGAPVLVHGDLHQRHLLLDSAGHAAGVIDWGDVCLGDPALDLSLAYSGFTGAARAALLDAYGPVPPEREARSRVLAVFLSAALAEYAHGERRTALLRESLAGISRAAR